MRLTLILLKPKPRHPGPGRWKGKGKSKIPIVSKFDIINAKERLIIEEENMLHLRNPYLTFEQSFGHAGEYGKGKAFIAKKYLESMENKLKPDTTLEERYAGLKVRDIWE